MTLLSIVSCVSLFPSKSVLYIDGTITCYKWWQYLLFFILIGFIIPFPMAILIASKIKQQNRTAKSVFCCLVFPLPYLVYWSVSICLSRRLRSHQYQENSTTNSDNDSSPCEQQSAVPDAYNREYCHPRWIISQVEGTD